MQMMDETINPSVEKSTLGAESICSENVNVENNVEMKGDVLSQEELQNLSSKTLKEIVLLFEKLVETGDIMEMNKHAEYIKATFYKVLKEEKIASGYQVLPGTPDYVEIPEEMDVEEAAEEVVEIQEEAEVAENLQDEISVNPFAEIERAFKSIYGKYKVQRAAYFQNLEKEKKANLEVRMQIIEDLKKLLETTEDINITYPAFRDLQNRWREAGTVPQQNVKDVYDTYQHFVEKFYDYVKINNEFRDLDFKKNLEAKEALCAQAEALEKEENIVNAFAKLQKLHEEWKEYGPVAKEYREQIWTRFRAVTSRINKLHQQYFEDLKVQQKENLAAKVVLCEKAEAVAQKEIDDSNIWNAASKELENLQKEWKTIGFASKKDNQKIYDRFRAACDTFYNRKREFYADFKEQMDRNLQKKISLCEQAEAVMESTDWKKTTDLLISLQKQWKEVGPVSRKKSEQIWTRFRAACDKFFDNKDKNYGGADPQHIDNLKAKLEIIDQINQFEGEATDKIAREFMDKWNAIGFVPFKEKESVQEKFKEAFKAKFPDYKRNRNKARGGKSRNEGYSGRSERERLVQRFRKLESEIATYENNLGFFASSKNADAFISEINRKIANARQELVTLEAQIREIDSQNE